MPRLSHTAARTVRAGKQPRAAKGQPRAAKGPPRAAKGPPRVAKGPRHDESVGAAIERCARTLRAARVYFGHGTTTARDEAAELVFFVAGLEHALGAAGYARALTVRQLRRIDTLLERRIAERIPLPYLTHRAFFAGLELYVDARVLVPRSPIAELIVGRFVPWIKPGRVRRILDIGTGSGAIALACARAFPRARVDAADISAAALQVCRRNMRRLKCGARVEALRSDHFSAVSGRRYDIIVSNPPYVGSAEMRRLPREYRHEPRLGLESGADGLDSVRTIFADARSHLTDDGILAVEVGNTETALLRAFPRLPFIWPRIEMGGGGVFILNARDLDAATGEDRRGG
ncbi:MAG TPA: 50S ribosomal protein L3 N(5)-glutamine methyltransferase [Steroidobacteraceae bacterium]|jgi:ribosomal protein L3 glutamine methyltransferase|nr:50S ribosomal protein L3 N(5)-glutamine methyltransferase [Steroidobacteraceae bacterium]